MLNQKEVYHLLKSSCKMYLENEGNERVSAIGMIIAFTTVLDNELNRKRKSMSLPCFCEWYLDNFKEIVQR